MAPADDRTTQAQSLRGDLAHLVLRERMAGAHAHPGLRRIDDLDRDVVVGGTHHLHLRLRVLNASLQTTLSRFSFLNFLNKPFVLSLGVAFALLQLGPLAL